jgi:DedD protein
VNISLKQRLIGAVVLLSAALILWPILFSDVASPVVDRRSQIPPIPEFEKFSVSKPQRPAGIPGVIDHREQVAEQEPVSDSLSERANNKAVGKPAPTAVETPKPVQEGVALAQLTQEGLPVYWALQVGSFRQQDKAEVLVKSLRDKGYKVDTRTVTTSKGTSVRVYVGPKLDKAQLLKDKSAIDAAFKVESMLVRFQG